MSWCGVFCFTAPLGVKPNHYIVTASIKDYTFGLVVNFAFILPRQR